MLEVVRGCLAFKPQYIARFTRSFSRAGRRHALLAAAALVLLGAVGARAQSTYTVNVTTDSNPTGGGSGSGTSGDLRYAITQADSNAGSTIQFSVTGTVTIAAALPAIATNMTITGPGASSLTISGNNAYTVFTADSGVTASISGLTIANGYAPNGGGVINSGTLTVTRCTISGNTATQGGGGLENYGAMTVVDSTISGNSASPNPNPGSAYGGGIDNEGTLILTESTVSGNSAAAGGANPSAGGGIEQDAGTLTLNNSIVEGNTVSGQFAQNADINGSYSGSGNLANTSTSAATLNPGLSPLGWHGGPTETMLPLPGSAAICAGLSSNLPSGVTTDQRGWPINTYGTCPSGYVDAGAVQTNYVSVQTLADDSGSDSASNCPGTSCSLRDAIDLANSATYDSQATGADIDFLSTLTSASGSPGPGAIQLGSGLTITGAANIAGPGANQLSVRGGGSTSNFSVFTINSGATATLYGLVISGGYSSQDGGGHLQPWRPGAPRQHRLRQHRFQQRRRHR